MLKGGGGGEETGTGGVKVTLSPSSSIELFILTFLLTILDINFW